MVALLAAAAALAAPPELPADFAAKADGYMAAQVAVNEFAGVVLVAVDGKPALRKGYGLANREWDVRHTPDTAFRLASVTKQFTAAAVLLLEEQGKLAVSDPVGKHLPDVPEGWANVTLLQLLSHTGGIPEHQRAVGLSPGGFGRHYTPRQVIATVKDKPLDFTPGEEWRYSNTGYFLLGMVIERASGKDFRVFLKDEVFGPLGMTDTRIERPGEVIPRRASGYSRGGGGVASNHIDPSLNWATGGAVSTADDLLKWDRALAAGGLLGPDARRTFFTPVKNGYACGVGVEKVYGRPAHLHGGALHPYGTRTFLLRLPDDGLCVVVLSNQDWADPGRMALDLAGIALGRKVEPPRFVAPPPRPAGRR